MHSLRSTCRSRKGAWIEIYTWLSKKFFFDCRSRKGAWIEIQSVVSVVFVVLSRSRKGAWIEIQKAWTNGQGADVAPVRERGLKFLFLEKNHQLVSRSRKGAWIEINLHLVLSD